MISYRRGVAVGNILDDIAKGVKTVADLPEAARTADADAKAVIRQASALQWSLYAVAGAVLVLGVALFNRR